MASIISGYEYDIFISYRQKDNKGERWVSEFVEALKAELESTFKEDVSVYYDINPHDGLLETHDVDDSLKDKLRCLVFIPIISQTYCDPKSFAWAHEFKAFVDLASNDQFGLKVKLPNGNVANRVLPVRIHELDPEDIRLCESLTGGFLRGVEFIYKEPGVNRPLRNNEDRPNDNLNRTYYRNQINKVANAIKDILSGIRTESVTAGKDKVQAGVTFNEDVTEKERSVISDAASPTRNKIFSKLAVAAVIIGTLIFLYPKLLKRDKFAGIRDTDGRISIAVMPFENLTGDTTLNWFERGISSLFINGLGNSPELAVRDDQTMFEVIESMNQVFTAGLSPSQAKKVAEKAKAETFLSGSFQGINGVYWILVNLIDTKSGNIIWTNKVAGDLKSSGYLTLVDSLCYEIKNYLEIKVLEQKADYDFREVFPESAEAYRYFIEGMNLFLKSDYEPAVKSLKKALDIDSTFTFASFYIAFAYDFGGNDQDRRQTSLWTQKAYKAKDRLPLKYQNWLEMWYACFVSENPDDINKYCTLLERNEIESRLFWLDIGTTYRYMSQQYDKAVEAFKRVEEISMERGSDWKYDNFYLQYCQALLLANQPGEAKRICEKGLEINPENNWLILFKASSNVMSGDTLATRKSITEIRSVLKQNNFPKSVEEYVFGQMYFWAKDTITAEKHWRKSYNLDPENIDNIANLIQALLRSGINVREGLELAQKNLSKYPDNNFFLWMKGLGYYKSGKYQEALVILKEADDNYMGYLKDLKDDIKKAGMAARIAGH
jgi:TolB-like protein